MNIYEITEEMKKLDESFEKINEKGEPSETDTVSYEQIRELLTSMLKNKTKNLIALIKNKKSLIKSIEEEEKRLSEYKKKEKKNLESIEKLLTYVMETQELKKVVTEIGTISLAKKPMRLEVLDLDKLPEEYKQITTTIKPNKIAIKKHLTDTGEVLDGVEYVKGEFYLRIK